MLTRLQNGYETMRNFVAARLKQLRLGKGLKQAAIAELIGCETNTISRYERAETMPNIEHLMKLAEVFEVSPMEILPPQGTALQRLFVLRQNLTEKALLVDFPEDLEDLIRRAEALIAARHASKK